MRIPRNSGCPSTERKHSILSDSLQGPRDLIIKFLLIFFSKFKQTLPRKIQIQMSGQVVIRDLLTLSVPGRLPWIG